MSTEIIDKFAIFTKIRESTAVYSDGTHREWQGRHHFSLPIKGYNNGYAAKS